jgi:uncharacterized protein YbaA (DUF1428 family)
MIEHPITTARLTAIADALEAEARHRVVLGWIETARERDARYRAQMEAARFALVGEREDG